VANFESPDDLLQFVKLLSSHLNELHFVEAFRQLDDWAGSAWTTSSEFLGELGLRCKAIMKRDGKRLPPSLREDLERCVKATA
jgi:hypothetical protein